MDRRITETPWGGVKGLWPLLLPAVLAIPLAAHAYLGTFSRYVADDYCTAAKAKELGFWGSQAYWYENWTGRFAYNGTLAALEILGSWVVPILPAAAILGWTIVLAWTLRAALPDSPWDGFPIRAFLPATLAILTVALTLSATPDVYQSLYWQTGLVNYVLPLLFLTLQAGILARSGRGNAAPPGPSRLRNALLLLILAMVSAGFSETYLLAQALVYGGTAAWMWVAQRGSRPKPALGEAAAGLVGTLLAGSVVILAPGNAVRVSLMPDRMDVPVVLLESLRYAAAFSAKTLLATPASFVTTALIAVGLGAVIGGGTGSPPSSLGRSVLKASLVGIAGALVLMISLILPSAYATAAYPVDRALVAPAHVSALVASGAGLAVGYVTGSRMHAGASRAIRRHSFTLLLAIGALFAVAGTSDAMSLADDVRDFAARWDQRKSFVVAAGLEDLRSLEVRPLPHIASLPELEDDPSNWVNLCFAQYHGFDSVVAR